MLVALQRAKGIGQSGKRMGLRAKSRTSEISSQRSERTFRIADFGLRITKCVGQSAKCGRDWSTNSFNLACINIDKFMGRQQRFYLRPYLCEKSVKLALSHITDPQMHDPRGWFGKHYSIRKIAVLCDNDVGVGACRVPKKCI